MRALVVVAMGVVASACTDPTAPDSNNVPDAAVEAEAAGGSVASERIVFSSLRPGNWDIFYFERPGAAPNRLTDHPGLDYDAEFSPDGRWVIFTSERRGNPDLYALDLEARDAEPRLLFESGAMEDQATISPDGQTIVFVSTKDQGSDIYAMPFRPMQTQSLDDAVNLTRHPDGDFRPAFSPDGQTIAFSSDRDTPAYGHPYLSFTRHREGEIYLMDRDGGNQRRLTNAPDWDGSPEWSADGETIYFYSARPRELPGPPTSPILGQEGGFRIWAMDVDGSNERAITPEGVEALAPALTTDGRIAFQTREGYQSWSIVSVSPNDGGATRLESDEASDYWTPHYDRNTGAMVAHGLGPTVAHSQAVDGVLGAGALLSADHPEQVSLPDRPVTLYPMRHTTGLAPHPLENGVVTTIETEAGSQLVLANFDGASEQDLFFEPGVGIVSGSRVRLYDMKFSNDGNWITYTHGFFAGETTNQSDIWLMRADGSERVNITNSEANDGVAAFSPDGERLVFRSGRSGNFELYTMNRDGSDVRQLTDHPGRDNFPMYSPAGDAIVFSSNRDSEEDTLGFLTLDNYILSLEDDGSPGELTRLTDDPGQDSHPWFSPDGAWIVYTSERDGITDEEPLVQEVVFGPQMYGEIYAQRLSDGLILRLTHNKWEEGNPFWLGPVQPQ